MIDRTNFLMSMQHAHPLGPWKAMLDAVIRLYSTLKQPKPFRILDLACGPRGEPGTTIAHALPLASVHCTDFCELAVAAIPVGDSSLFPDRLPPPKNLTKSVIDLTDLSMYDTGTFHAITCCYGYSLSSDLPKALSEAHRVLVPGGALVIATWEQSALVTHGRDVVAFCRGGGRDVHAMDDDEAFLPPRLAVKRIALSAPGEFESLLVDAGFDTEGAILMTKGTYPFDLGNESDLQFSMGTLLVRDELERLGAYLPTIGGWKNLAQEAFWSNIYRYADRSVDGTLFLRENTFKLTVSTKKADPDVA